MCGKTEPREVKRQTGPKKRRPTKQETTDAQSTRNIVAQTDSKLVNVGTNCIRVKLACLLYTKALPDGKISVGNHVPRRGVSDSVILVTTIIYYA